MRKYFNYAINMLITRVCTRIIFELLCEKIPQLKNNIDRNLIKDHLSVKIYSGDVFDYTLHKPRQISTPSDIPNAFNLFETCTRTHCAQVLLALSHIVLAQTGGVDVDPSASTHIHKHQRKLLFHPRARLLFVHQVNRRRVIFVIGERSVCAVCYSSCFALSTRRRKNPSISIRVLHAGGRKKKPRKNSGEKSSHLCVQPARKTERKQTNRKKTIDTHRKTAALKVIRSEYIDFMPQT